MRPLLLFLFGFTLTACIPARTGPTIGAVQVGPGDGTMVVRGDGFGRHPLRFEWLGGADGPIENAAAGAEFARPGWATVPFPDRFRPTIDDRRAYSGSKSILFDSVRHGDGRCGVVYDPGKPVAVAYSSWLAYIDTGGHDGQWKMFRLNWQGGVEDTAPEAVLFDWFGSPGSLNIRRLAGDMANRFYPGGYPESGEWVRVELLLTPSSAPGRTDGSVELWMHRPGREIRKVLDKRGLETYLPGELRRWRYFVFQNYLGNGLGGKGRVWMDDVYVQATAARVEIGDAPRWPDCRRREIQPPLRWQPREIAFRFNPGGFSPGEPLFLYIVDAAGRVNEKGFPLAGKASLPR